MTGTLFVYLNTGQYCNNTDVMCCWTVIQLMHYHFLIHYHHLQKSASTTELCVPIRPSYGFNITCYTLLFANDYGKKNKKIKKNQIIGQQKMCFEYL